MKLERFIRWVEWGILNHIPDFPSRLVEVGKKVMEGNPDLLDKLPRNLNKLKERVQEMTVDEKAALERFANIVANRRKTKLFAGRLLAR